MAIDKMKRPDPEKKKTLPDVTVVGVRKKPVDLPEVTVTGVRKKPTEEDFSKRKTLSDEYKAKLWEQDVQVGRGSPEKNERNGRIDMGASDYNNSESDYAKQKGAVGKMMVEYSDGSVKKLGEKYVPEKKGRYANVEPKSGKYYDGGGKSWLEWYQSKKKNKK